MTPYEELADYRRRVAAIYERARRLDCPAEVRWADYRQEREQLFRHHPQSALSAEQRASFSGLKYFPYDPGLRFAVELDRDVQAEDFEVPLEQDGLMRMTRFAKVHFPVGQQQASLSLFWINGYAGGIFLPFRDQTNGSESYGGGRYLLDTIKHADLGREGGRPVLDFNFAYNPSCAYHPRWSCPLAPPENWLTVPITAGEKRYDLE